jgi:hypothetical protein
MCHVFISYVRDNQEIIDKLYSDLCGHGIKVWLDRNNIEPGTFWKDSIRRAISSGAFFIACFSVEYGSRDYTYMNEELTLAIEELRKRSIDRAWFIPVLLSGIVPDRSIGAGETLTSLQRLDLNEKNWEESVQRLLQVIKPKLLQATKPQIKILVSQTTGTDYTDLRNILRNKRWKEADHKTAELMLEVAKQENQGWLNVDSIQKFPIEDLQIIDHLWFENSDEKYGFRILTRVWKECGSPTNYTDKIGCAQWDEFGDNVGWKEAGNWLYSYSDMNSLIILPFQIFVRGGTRLDGKFWVLFTRLDACQNS